MHPKTIDVWHGHEGGIKVTKWFPWNENVVISGGGDSSIKIWQLTEKKSVWMATFKHGKSPVRDLCFNNNGLKFLSCAKQDPVVKLWDSERGICVSQFANSENAGCAEFYPEHKMSSLLLVGTESGIVCWDVRDNSCVPLKYDGNSSSINSILYVDDYEYFVTTSEDMKVRVSKTSFPDDDNILEHKDLKNGNDSFAALSACTSLDRRWLICQTNSNKIMGFGNPQLSSAFARKMFIGHEPQGYRCIPDMSADMCYVISGDANGMIFIWDWKSTEIVGCFKAHEHVCISATWNPWRADRVLSIGTDGVIKYWDLTPRDRI